MDDVERLLLREEETLVGFFFLLCALEVTVGGTTLGGEKQPVARVPLIEVATERRSRCENVDVPDAGQTGGGRYDWEATDAESPSLWPSSEPR